MVGTNTNLRRSLVGGVVAFVASIVGGCASKGPPPRPAETSIDTESARREAKRPDPNEGEIVFTSSEPGVAHPSAPSAAAAEPASNVPGAGPSNSATSSTSGSPASGGPRVTKAQCEQLFDKYIQLVTGLGSADVAGFKSMFDENPAFQSYKATLQGFHTSCLKDQTKAQYTCAMGARTTEEFQKCIG